MILTQSAGIWLKLNTGPSLNVKKFIGVYALLAAVGFVAQGLVIGYGFSTTHGEKN